MRKALVVALLLTLVALAGCSGKDAGADNDVTGDEEGRTSDGRQSDPGSGEGAKDPPHKDVLILDGDLSLIGFDNLPAAAWTPYQLTTFEQPLDAMVSGVLGHIEAHQLRRNGGEPPAATRPASTDGVIYCPPRLIVRRTAGGAA